MDRFSTSTKRKIKDASQTNRAADIPPTKSPQYDDALPEGGRQHTPDSETAAAMDLNQQAESTPRTEIPDRNNVGPQQPSGAGLKGGNQSSTSAQSSNVAHLAIQNSKIEHVTFTTGFGASSSMSSRVRNAYPEKKYSLFREEMKSKMKTKYEYTCEGLPTQGNRLLFNNVYTELYMTESTSWNINTKYKARQSKMTAKLPAKEEKAIKCEDIFNFLYNKKLRTVLTKGIAGIGKTFAVQKFILDWAEGNANMKPELIFPLPFCELNAMKDIKFSLLGLLQHFHPNLKGIDCIDSNGSNVGFIFDGLDECRLPLDFKGNLVWCDVRKRTSVDILLTNLISGNLLLFASLWITTRPAASHRIPPQYIHQVTEINGFEYAQLTDYFLKKFGDDLKARSFIKYIKTGRGLYDHMGSIPLFSWTLANIGRTFLHENKSEQLSGPQIYTHFLRILTIIKQQKYDTIGRNNTNITESIREIIVKLGKLAYRGLLNGTYEFDENDLTECEINVQEVSVCSGILTENFIMEYGLYVVKVYSFVRLTVQEYLAALYMLCTYTDEPKDRGSEKDKVFYFSESSRADDEKNARTLFKLCKDFLEKALSSNSKHLDGCLYFLLSFLLDSKQSYLKDLFTLPERTVKIIEELVLLINKKINEKPPPRKIEKLLRCLKELNYNSSVNNMQIFLNSGSLYKEELTPEQCSTLTYRRLTLGGVPDEFDLKMYNVCRNGMIILFPIIGIFKTAKYLQLECQYTVVKRVAESGYISLVSTVQPSISHLEVLDLIYNPPGESGLSLLSAKLEDPQCTLEKLSTDHGGESRNEMGLRKYACSVSLGPCTANAGLLLSEVNQKVKLEEHRRYRICLTSEGLVCKESLTGGRCYWEVEWQGFVGIGMAYKKTCSEMIDSFNAIPSHAPWLICTEITHDDGSNGQTVYYAVDERMQTKLNAPHASRIRVYLDRPGGTLSFYTVLPDKISHLYTFGDIATQEMCPVFLFLEKGYSVSLCKPSEDRKSTHMKLR